MDNKNTVEIITAENQDMHQEDIARLETAKYGLENISVVMQGLNKVGNTIESGLNKLSDDQQKWISEKVNMVLLKLLKSNVITMEKNKEFKEPSNLGYKTLVGLTGFGSGFVGSTNPVGATIFVSELVLSTRYILRSIMDIARSEGEDIYQPETQLACLQVFALSGNFEDSESMDTSYYGTRMTMAAAMRGATSYLTKYGVSGLGRIMMTTGNPILQMIGLIATRLTIQIGEKFISQAVPVLGAAGGGALNYVFMDHFQQMAKSHFTIRNLEKKYGLEIVKSYYKQIEV